MDARWWGVTVRACWVLLALVCGAANATPLYQFDGSFGGVGDGDGSFRYPYGVAYDDQDCLYVSDSGNSRIQRFRADMSFLGKWGVNGGGDGEFGNNYRIAIGLGKWLYVTDSGSRRIQRFQLSGFFLGKWGSLGDGDGQFRTPQGICTNAAGDVYVTDGSKHSVQRFDSLGVFIGTWGSKGSDNDQFRNPIDVAVDKVGNVYVSDHDNRCVKVFTATGSFLRKFGETGTGDGQFMAPRGMTFGPGNYVYVCDNVRHDVQKFTAQGTFVGRIGRGFGWADWYMKSPEDVAIDSQNRVMVAEYDNHRLQRFRLNKAPTVPAAVTILPASPCDSDRLVATGSGATDPDGDQVGYRYQWFRSTNGADWTKGPVTRVVAAEVTVLGEYWKCQARATDGVYSGPWATSVIVQITAPNRPPTAPVTIEITPSSPRGSDALSAAANGATDPDGDAVTYQYQWYRSANGVTWTRGPAGAVVAARLTVVGEYWRVAAAACDGQVMGPKRVSAAVQISSD